MEKKNHHDDVESPRSTQDQWYGNNETSIESLFQDVETQASRIRNAGFFISTSGTTRGIIVKFFGPFGYPRRSVAIEPNYSDGFSVRFSTSHRDIHVGRAFDRTKERQFAFGRKTERRIRSWIKWVATGRRPFWTL